MNQQQELRDTFNKITKEKGITMKLVSSLTGISEGCLYQWKSGVNGFSQNRLNLVETFLEKINNF